MACHVYNICSSREETLDGPTESPFHDQQDHQQLKGEIPYNTKMTSITAQAY